MNSSRNFNIISTSHYDRQVKKLYKSHKSLPSDLERLKQQLLKNPASGTPLGKDCYKIRLAIQSKKKGKSGGARIITCVKLVKQTIYLLTIFDKSTKQNISEKELNMLLKLAGL